MKRDWDIWGLLGLTLGLVLSLVPLGVLYDLEESMQGAEVASEVIADEAVDSAWAGMVSDVTEESVHVKKVMVESCEDESFEEKADSIETYSIIEKSSDYSDVSEGEILVEYAGASAESGDALALLDVIRGEYGLDESNFSFFYYSTLTGETCVYNPDTLFTAASTVKVPVNMLYYDAINRGERTLDDILPYHASATDTEGAGSTPYDYRPGALIPLSYLLEQSIVNSDNTANNILIQNLGGFSAYRHEMIQYSDSEYPEEFFAGNKLCARFSFDVITWLYTHSDEYSELIEHMKNACAGGYLQKGITAYPVAHKYGDYDGCHHDYGIVYTPFPYLIGIFTSNVPDSENTIAAIGSRYTEYTLNTLPDNYIKIK